ncbi:MAG: NAD-dependent epimerase/dehydratase family protein [bacterium]
MKALVTGGGGFIGSHVVRSLLEDGHSVRVLHLPDEDVSHLEGSDSVSFETGDTRDADRMREVVDGCDWVFHLAALYRIWMPDPDPIYQVNVEGTRNVMNASIDAGVERIIYTSSLVVYQPVEGVPITEERPLRDYDGTDDYTRSKLQAHQLVQEYVEDGHDIVITAPTLPIGPGDFGPTPTGRILLSTIRNPIAVTLDTDANCGDVRDIARGHVLAAEKGKSGESYLLGGQNTSMKELARLVQEVTGTSKPVVSPPPFVTKAMANLLELYSDWVSGEPPDFTPAAIEVAQMGFDADCTKAKTELGLPERAHGESVKDALEWFKANGYVDY